MPTKTQRSIVPLLEENQQPSDLEEFENEVKKLLEEDVPEKTLGEQDYQYQSQENTQTEGTNYHLQNQDELEINQLPGMESIEEDFSIKTSNYGGIDKIGVGTDGTVTIENSSGLSETYFLAGAYQGQAAIKDENNIIWKYDTIEDQLHYRSHSTAEWIESESSRHKNKLDKVIEFQQQLWALDRAQQQVRDWSYSDKDKGKRDRMKTSFDHVMEELTIRGEYEPENHEHTNKEKARRSSGARSNDIIKDFKKARKRFRAYSLLKYGIDPVDEIKVINDSESVEYQPRQF